MFSVFEPIVSEFDSSDYNAWFKAKVEASQVGPHPTIPHDEVVARLNKRREERE